MDMTLADLCKQLRVNGVYAYVQEYQPDNPDLNQFLTSALQAELDKRHLNHQMRLLRQAGFPIPIPDPPSKLPIIIGSKFS